MKKDKGNTSGQNDQTKDIRLFIKKTELFDMQAAIKLMNGIISSELGDYRAKLRRQIDRSIDEMNDFMKTDEWKRISKLYADIDEECASLDSSGNPKRNSRGEIIIATENILKRETLLIELTVSEQENITIRKEIWRKYVESFNEDIDITHFVRIPKSLFEGLKIVTEVKDWLWPVIDETK